LLGLGPDGHTASLFPGTTALAVEDRLAVVVDVPGHGARRLTLTYPVFLEAARSSSWSPATTSGPRSPTFSRPESTLPAARIVHRPGPTRIFCDREAAPEGPRQDINAPP
jgi:6-phosphogluconolactonase